MTDPAEIEDYDITGLADGAVNVVIAAGATAASFTVETNEDDAEYDDETVTLGFGTLPTGVIAGEQATAVFTIDDDDIDPAIGNHPPAFLASAYEFEALEATTVGSQVGWVSATDPNPEDTVTYAFTRRAKLAFSPSTETPAKSPWPEFWITTRLSCTPSLCRLPTAGAARIRRLSRSR